MIVVKLRNIEDMGLPLDTTEKVVKRGDAKRILRGLERKYGLKSHHLFMKISSETYWIYDNAAYAYIPREIKRLWFDNYKIYIASSLVYKFWIFYNKIF